MKSSPPILNKHKKDRTDELLSCMLTDTFRAHIKKTIEKDTWGKGKPMYYMNEDKQLIEHWKDGRIITIKQIEQ